MESDTIESSSESKFPLIAGIAGVALGVIALILAVKAKGAADNAAAAAALAGESAAAAAASVGNKADVAMVNAVSAEVSELRNNTVTGFKQVEVALGEMQKGRASGRSSGGSAPQVAADGEYIVVKGDTLSGIARKLGMSLKALQDLNPGAGNALRIGQKLRTK
jgi:LysM repeat protein